MPVLYNRPNVQAVPRRQQALDPNLQTSMIETANLTASWAALAKATLIHVVCICHL